MVAEWMSHSMRLMPISRALGSWLGTTWSSGRSTGQSRNGMTRGSFPLSLPLLPPLSHPRLSDQPQSLCPKQSSSTWDLSRTALTCFVFTIWILPHQYSLPYLDFSRFGQRMEANRANTGSQPAEEWLEEEAVHLERVEDYWGEEGRCCSYPVSDRSVERYRRHE